MVIIGFPRCFGCEFFPDNIRISCLAVDLPWFRETSGCGIASAPTTASGYVGRLTFERNYTLMTLDTSSMKLFTRCVIATL